MKTLSTAVSIGLLLAGVSAMGQTIAPAPGSGPALTGDFALAYYLVRSNTQPGECGCFYLNGGGLSGSLDLGHRLTAVLEVSGKYSGNGPSTGNSLTLVSYLGGARYDLSQPWLWHPHRLQPFAQVLVGAAHAGGGIAGAGDGSTAFLSRVGGGLNVPVRDRFALRIIEVDYESTNFANNTNAHQNNLLLGAGVVYRWSRSR